MLVEFIHVDLFFPSGALLTDGVAYSDFDTSVETFISDDNTLEIITAIAGLRFSEGISLVLKDHVLPGKQKIHIYHSKNTQYHRIVILTRHKNIVFKNW